MNYEDYFNEEILKAVQKTTEYIELVRKSIKHPHFKYAIYNIGTGEVKYKWKPWYRWFSGKREVVKIYSFEPIEYSKPISYVEEK